MEAMKSDIDEVALQGIEFWSNVCDEEVDLVIEASEAQEQGRPPERTSRFYARGALQYLIPVLTQSLTKQVRVTVFMTIAIGVFFLILIAQLSIMTGTDWLGLILQEEFDDDDEWNPCKAAGVCLMLMATCCEDTIIAHVLPFVNDNISSPDWRFRDAAVMSFGKNFVVTLF